MGAFDGLKSFLGRSYDQFNPFDDGKTYKQRESNTSMYSRKKREQDEVLRPLRQKAAARLRQDYQAGRVDRDTMAKRLDNILGVDYDRSVRMLDNGLVVNTKPDNNFTAAVKGLGSGVMDLAPQRIAGGAAEYLGRVSGNRTLEQFGENWAQPFRDMRAVDSEQAGNKGVYTAGNVIGGLVTLPIAPAGKAGMAFRALKYGAPQAGDTSYAIKQGGGGRLAQTLGGGITGGVSGALGTVGAEKILNPANKLAGTALRRVGQAGLYEGAEEAVESLTQSGVAKTTYNKDLTLADAAKDAAMSAAIGAAAGGAMRGGIELGSPRKLTSAQLKERNKWVGIYNEAEAKGKTAAQEKAAEKISEIDRNSRSIIGEQVDKRIKRVKADGPRMFGDSQPDPSSSPQNTQSNIQPVPSTDSLAQGKAMSVEPQTPQGKVDPRIIEAIKKQGIIDTPATNTNALKMLNAVSDSSIKEVNSTKNFAEWKKLKESQALSEGVSQLDLESRFDNLNNIAKNSTGLTLEEIYNTVKTPKRSQLSGQALSTRSRDIGKALGMTDQQMQEAANTEENLLQTNQQGLEQLENRSLTTKSSQPAFRIRSSQTAENATKEASTNLQSQEIKAIPSDDSITQSVNEQINHPQIPKRNKANVIDYFRTPQRVLEKIGLADAGKALVEADRAYKKELPTQIEKITQWYERIGNSNEASTRIFKYLDGQKGAKAKLQGNELEVANEMKAYLAEWADRLNLPKDGRVTNYITHIFEDQLIEKDFDPDLARLIDDKVPGSVYDPFTQQRLGAKGYVEDAIRALDAYTKRAVRKANMDPALDVLKKQADTLDVESWKYVKRLGDRINMRPTEMDNLLDNLVKASPIGYRLGSRPTARVTQAIRKATYRATLGLNVGSAVRNLTQGINTFAELGGQYTGVGYTKVIGNMFNGGNAELEQVGVLDNSFIEDRTLSAKHKAAQRMDKVLFAAFEKAEQINRGAAYFGAKQKALKAGKSEADAVNAGIEAARKTQFTFGRVETPIALQGDINKLFTQFQSYNVKQAEFVGGMISNKEYAKMARYTIATLAVFALMSKALGYRPEDMIPFGSNIKDGKLPIATAPAFRVIPEAVDFGKAVFSTPSEGAKTPKNEKVVEAAKDFGAAIGSSSIPGFVQAKKTYGGVKAFRDGEMERYGEGTVQIEQTPQNFVKGAVFGPYALKTTEQPTQPTVKTKDRQAQVTTAPSNSWENLVTNYNDETLRKGMTDTEKTIAKTLNDLPQGISEEARNELVKYARLTPDGRKKVYNDMNNELKLKYAEFERDKISGTLTSAEEFKAAKDIAKLEIGTKYGQEAYDMYSLAKYEIENLATPEMYNRLLAYDMELYERGLISSPKLDENKDRVKRSSGGVKTALKSAIAYATPEQISVPSVRTAQAPTRKLRIPTIQTGGGGAPKGRKYTVKVAKLS